MPIRDISTAVLAILDARIEVTHNQAINIGRPEDNRRIREIAEIVREVVPDTELEFAVDASPDKRNYRVDCNKATRLLTEWKPEWDVRQGAIELYAGYQRVGLTLEEFEGPRFNRIKHVMMLMNEGTLDENLKWQSDG